MPGIFVSLLISFAASLLRHGITVVFEARKLRRPNIRDKEGTRAYLENLLRWIAYFQKMFFPDLATPAFTIAILIEIVQPGEKWNAFYDAIVHDFNVSTQFPPAKYSPDTERVGERQKRIECLCSCLKNKRFGNDLTPENNRGDLTDLERQAAEEYLAVVRRLLDHPAILAQAEKTYRRMK